jgi:YD repeat-containing protein
VPLLAALLLAAAGLADADERATLTGGIVPTTEGDRFALQWSGQSGARYRVQSRTNLNDAAGWTTVDVMRADSNAVPVRWTAPEVLRQQHFYRLAGPDAEIFTVEPALAPPNAPVTLYVLGQCFQSNDVLRVGGAVHGGAVLSAAVSSVSLGAQPPGWQRVELVRDGLVLSFFDVFFGDASTAPELVLQGPPEMPPASPVASTAFVFGHGMIVVPSDKVAVQGRARGHVTVLKSHDDGHVTVLKGRARGHVTVLKSHGGDVDDDCDGYLAVSPDTGEVLQQETDLAIPGRGLDFAWVRTYRSRTGGDSPMGQGWTHSYDIRCAANGQDMDLFDGTGRRDTLKRGDCADGVCAFSAPGMFREGALSNDVFRLTFADSGYWEFLPLDGTSAAGRIARSVDRNGNTLRFEYAASGRLRYVIDTLDRTNTLTYTAEGRVASVTDFSGRAVTYAYVRSDLDLSGAIGDLKSVTSPPVTGTSTGNDFPSGKTTTYTYTRGFTDNRLNHNLRTAADGLRQTQFELVYASTEDPTNFDFDTVQSVLRGVEKQDIRRLALPPDPTNAFATVRCILNDFVGNVTEEFYDARHRLLRRLEFTGRANPAEPTTDTLNRPVNPLRPDDPPFFETRWEWNNDSHCAALHRPQTNRVEWLYQSDFDPGTPPRHRGNLRVARITGPFDGDASNTKVSVHYNPRGPRASGGRLLKLRFMPFWISMISFRPGLCFPPASSTRGVLRPVPNTTPKATWSGKRPMAGRRESGTLRGISLTTHMAS